MDIVLEDSDSDIDLEDGDIVLEDSDIEEALRLVSQLDDETALQVAIWEQNLEDVDRLLKQNDKDIKALEDNVGSFLIMTCQIKHANPNIILILLQHGCSLHAKDREQRQRSAIHYAVEVCSLEVIKLLIEHGADMDEQDVDLNTSLHIAINRKDPEIMAMLLYYNVDTTISNVFGPPIRGVYTPEIMELILPYTDLCLNDVLYSLDVATVTLLLHTYQTKSIFAEWLLEDIPSRVQEMFIIYRRSQALMSQFLHEVYEDEDMYEVMYQPEASVCIVAIVSVMRPKRDSPNGFLPDMLRLLLSNYNVIKQRTLEALQLNNEFAPNIICILQDLDVIIQQDSRMRTCIFPRLVRPTRWPLLWRMYTKPHIDLKEDLLRAVDNERDYTVVKRFFAIGQTPSLVELSRNKIRHEIIKKYAKLKPNQPFHYATVLKSLPIPREVLDILLLRKSLYLNA